MRKTAFKYSHMVAGSAGILIGCGVIYEGWNYSMGSLTRMGPGYFPFMLGLLLIGLSVLVLLFEGRAVNSPDIPPPAWRGLLWISLAVAAFAFLIDRGGLAPAVIAAVVLTSFADDDLSWKETAVLALAAAGVCCGVFIFILGLPLDAIKVG